MKLIVLREAKLEAEQAAAWYDVRGKGKGIRFMSDFEAALALVEESPYAFTRLETMQSSREIRRYRMKKHPYLIIYEIEDEEIVVQAVAHERRRPNYWSRRKR